jgi:GGDEF domain-containing protein
MHRRQAAADQLDEFGRAFTLLMEGIALHIVRAPGLDPDEMRAQIRDVDEDFVNYPTGANAMSAASGANQAMQEYNKTIERQLKGLGDELRALISVFCGTVINLAPTSEKAITDIQAAQAKLAQSTRFEDFRSLRSEFEESLKLLKEEHARFITQQAGLGAGQHEDPVTGLPGRSAGEEYIAQLSKISSNVYLACFVVERVDMFNERYGFSVGDQILQLFTQKVTLSMSETERMFRWRGSVFVAVMQRNDNVEKVRSDLLRFTNALRSEHVISLKNRSVMLPVSAVSTLIAIRQGAAMDAVVSSLDEFVKTKQDKGS